MIGGTRRRGALVVRAEKGGPRRSRHPRSGYPRLSPSCRRHSLKLMATSTGWHDEDGNASFRACKGAPDSARRATLRPTRRNLSIVPVDRGLPER